MPRRATAEVFTFIEPVSPYLSHNYYDLLKKQEEQTQCAICLEDIECKRCFSLLCCGHYFHLCCIIHIKDRVCPVCRT